MINDAMMLMTVIMIDKMIVMINDDMMLMIVMITIIDELFTVVGNKAMWRW